MKYHKFPLKDIKVCPFCGYTEDNWKWCIIYIGPCPSCRKDISIESRKE